MSIVKYRGSNGALYAYESTSRWNPTTKRSEPIRKYLGRVNEATGEIIPTSGKRRRKNQTSNTAATESEDSNRDSLSSTVHELQSTIMQQQEYIRQIENENARLKSILGAVATQTSEFAT